MEFCQGCTEPLPFCQGAVPVVLLLGGQHSETNICPMFLPQLYSMAAALNMFIFLHLLTATALELDTDQGIKIQYHLFLVSPIS